jgi:cell division septum initiation protein DivIVA
VQELILAGSFELVRKGYDPQSVERELRSLNAELIRLSEQNSQLQDQVRALTIQLRESEAALNAAGSPNFAALGSRAATLLSVAQQIAGELEVDAKATAERITSEARVRAEQVLQDADSHYQAVVAEADRRAQRRLTESAFEGDRLLSEAKSQAEEIARAAETEAARVRGGVATEVAALRATAKRELEQLRAALELKLAQQAAAADPTPDKELEAALKARRAEAETDYLEKHQAAVALTEQYLANANQELASLQQRVRDALNEAEALEFAAATTQQRMLDEARERSEGLIHAAEAQARQIVAQAAEIGREAEAKAAENLLILRNQADAIEIYLQNLRSLVSGELSKRGEDGPVG